jgi:hypothetical protein
MLERSYEIVESNNYAELYTHFNSFLKSMYN